MKKIIAFLCALTTFATVAAGCKSNNSNDSNSGNNTSNDINAQTPVDYEDTYYRPDAGIDRSKPIGFLYQNGATPYKVVIPANATATEEYAANEFATYFRELTGVTIPVVSDASCSYSEDDCVISIGKTIYQENADLSDVDYDDLTTDGFITKSVGKGYILDSGTKDGLIYSAYNFLEIYFGLEFLTPSYTYKPEVPNEVVAYETNIIDIPAFAVRDYYSYTAFYEQGGTTAYYGAKMRNNTSTYKQVEEMDQAYYFTYYCSYNGDANWYPQRMGHTNTHLLAADAYVNYINPTPVYKTNKNGASANWELGYFNEHNDWYAWSPDFRNNSLGYSQEELCYSNGLTWDGEYDEEAEDSLVDKMIEICQIMILDERNSEATKLMLGHGDYEAKCLCEKCLHFYDEFGGYSGATCVWINVISEKILEWMEMEGIDREITFVIFGYNKSIDPPVVLNSDGTYTPYHEKAKLNENCAVQIAWFGCNTHTLFDEDCAINSQKYTYMKGWKAITSTFEIWDYDCVFTDSLWYHPGLFGMKDRYMYYVEIGADKVLTQGCPNLSFYYQHYLHQYVSLKLMWNPNRDVNALIAHFNKLYFTEKYAGYVDTYLDIFNNHLVALDEANSEGLHITWRDTDDTKKTSSYSYDLLMSLTNLLNKAIAEVEADTSLTQAERTNISDRLRSVVITPQFMMLRLGYIIDQSALKEYAKDFFDNIDRLGMMDKGMRESMEKFSAYKATFNLD